MKKLLFLLILLCPFTVMAYSSNAKSIVTGLFMERMFTRFKVWRLFLR